MRQLSLYIKGDSFVHKIDPITKIVYIIDAVLIPIVIPSKLVALSFLVFTISLLLIARVFSSVIKIFSFSAFLLLSVIIIQGLFNPDNVTIYFSIGPLVFYKEGLSYALKVFLRVVNILGAFSILILTTSPMELINSLVSRGLPSKVGYVLSSVFQLIPQMKNVMSTITDAQRSRGLETEGNILIRIKAFFPLIIPTVVTSLNNTHERAMALDIRGFNSKVKKTHITLARSYSFSKYITLLLIIMLIFSFIWRFLV